MRLQSWFLAVCFSLGGLGSAQAAPVPFSSGDWAKIDRGEVVVTIGPTNGTQQLYQVAGTLNAKQAQIYRMLTDFDGHARIFSKVKKSYIKKRLSADHVQVYKDLDLPWPMSGKWVLSDTTLRPDMYGYVWKSIDGNVGIQHGSYETLTRKDKSLLVYQIWYDMAKSAVPKILFNKAQQVALPGLVEDCRKAVSRY